MDLLGKIFCTNQLSSILAHIFPFTLNVIFLQLRIVVVQIADSLSILLVCLCVCLSLLLFVNCLALLDSLSLLVRKFTNKYIPYLRKNVAFWWFLPFSMSVEAHGPLIRVIAPLTGRASARDTPTNKQSAQIYCRCTLCTFCHFCIKPGQINLLHLVKNVGVLAPVIQYIIGIYDQQSVTLALQALRQGAGREAEQGLHPPRLSRVHQMPQAGPGMQAVMDPEPKSLYNFGSFSLHSI